MHRKIFNCPSFHCLLIIQALNQSPSLLIICHFYKRTRSYRISIMNRLYLHQLYNRSILAHLITAKETDRQLSCIHMQELSI